MFRRRLEQIRRSEKGITGIETAIILIAFVVVAAVFAYTLVSAGLFATQESKEAIHGGLEEAKGCLEVRGAVIALANSTGKSGTVAQVTFMLASALGGTPIDFTPPTDSDNDGVADANSQNVVVMSYLDNNNRVDDLYWSVRKCGSSDIDNLLEDGELFQVTIGQSTAVGNLVDALDFDLSVNTTFTIEIKPPVGAVLALQRTTPPDISSIMNLT